MLSSASIRQILHLSLNSAIPSPCVTTTPQPPMVDLVRHLPNQTTPSISLSPSSESSATASEEGRHADQTHKKYKCNRCSAGYDHRKNLREHKQAKHQRIRYFCNVEGCNESVAQKKNLARHKAGKHGITAKL